MRRAEEGDVFGEWLLGRACGPTENAGRVYSGDEDPVEGGVPPEKRFEHDGLGWQLSCDHVGNLDSPSLCCYRNSDIEFSPAPPDASPGRSHSPGVYVPT